MNYREKFFNIASQSPSNGSNVRKQLLPLKPPASYGIQYLDNKPKQFKRVNEGVPVTNLKLKKKKPDENSIVNLTYRKPSTENNNNKTYDLNTTGERRSGSPTSSGYGTDSHFDFEHHEYDNEYPPLRSMRFCPQVTSRFCGVCYGSAVSDAEMLGFPIPSASVGPWASHELSDHFPRNNYSLFDNVPMQNQRSNFY